MGIINRGGHVEIHGQAIGTPSGDGGDDAAEEIPATGTGNTGVINYGGTVEVHESWVNGEWIE